jgi:hypothetical protein
MQAEKYRKLLVSGRAAVGWLSVLTPNLIGRAWRMQPPLGNNVKYAIRLFGARNALLAYQLPRTSSKKFFGKELPLMRSTFFSVSLTSAGIGTNL